MSTNHSRGNAPSVRWPEELDRCLESFQARLYRGQQPTLEDYLPDSPAAALVLVELVHIELEFRLKHGEPVRIEEYLTRYPRLADDAAGVVELVSAEYTIRRRGDPTLAWQSYLPRFPAYQDALTARLPHAGDSMGQLTLPSREVFEQEGVADLPRVPGYEMLSELGHGGMGVVYKARQLALNRIVALKMLPAALQGNAAQRARFRVEVETIAQLQHPNIVQVYDVGECQGRPFFAMEFVEGGNLTDHCRGEAQPPNEAAELVETLAHAMHAIHAKGIIHRDLKPSNIVRTTEGCPKITDFGLARNLSSDLTASGEILGTPSYMAPEQAAGKVREIGPAADVYALGAILYELLTGRAPFHGMSVLDVVRQVQDSDPVTPRRLEPRTPRDLEIICLKCLRKEPGRRYASALDLAEDLQRFLKGEPVHARPPAWPERVVRWSRRRPAVAALLVVVCLIALAAPLALLGHTLQLEEALTRTQEERSRAQRAEEQARINEAEARVSRYAADLHLAHNLFKTGDVFQLPDLLDPYGAAGDETGDLRGFEWWHLRRYRQVTRPALTAHDGPLHLLAYSPDGRSLITGGGDPNHQTLHLWNLQTGHSLFRQALFRHFPGHLRTRAAYAPQGASLAGATEDGVVVWDFASEKTKSRLRPNGEVAHIALSPNGRWLVVDDETGITISDCVATTKRKTLPAQHVVRFAFTPDSDTLLTICNDTSFRGLQWWDPATGAMREQRRFDRMIVSAAFSPHGTFLLLVDEESRGAIWDAKQRIPLVWSDAIGRARSMAVSPDEQTLAIGDDEGGVRLWDIPTASVRGHYRWQPTAIVELAFSPDNRIVAAATAEGIVHQLDATVRHVPDSIQTFSSFGLPVWSPDGETVAVSVWGGAIRLFDRRTLAVRAVVRCPVQNVRCMAFAPDGRTLAAACFGEKFVRLWNATDGRLLGVTPSQSVVVSAIAYSPDGRHLASADGKQIRFWDPATRTDQGCLETSGDVHALAFTPDGRSLLTANSSVQVWDIRDNGSPPRKPSFTVPVGSTVVHLAVSRDGRQVATGESDGTVRVWRFSPDGKLIPQGAAVHWKAREEPVRSLAFGANGSTLLVTGYHRAILCEMPAGCRQDILAGTIDRGALSPDGRTLATTGDDGVVRLWDVTTWRARQPCGHALGGVRSLVFSTDGRLLFTASRVAGLHIQNRRLLAEETAPLRDTAESLRFWNAATGQEEPSAVPMRETMTPPYVVARSPDGRLLAAGAEDGGVHIWDMPGRRWQARRFVSEKARAYAQLLELTRLMWTNSNPDYSKNTEAVAALAFSPTGHLLAMAGNRGSIRVWETGSWKEYGHWIGDPGGSTWLAFTPAGDAVIGSRGGQVCIWDARTAELLATLGEEADSPVLCGVFLPGKEVIALGSKDGAIRLWNPLSGDLQRLPRGHQDRITSLAFTPDGKTLASASWDRTVRLWNLRANREVAALEGHKGRVHAVAFSPDGKLLASGGDVGVHSGEVLLWRR